MEFKTPTLILLGFVLVALSFSILGLAADNMSFVHAHQHDDFQVHYYRYNETANAQYSYWLKMDYVPSRFTLSKEAALLANGVICAIAGAAVVATAFFMRKANAKRTGLSPYLISVICATTAFVTSLAVAIYAWSPVMKWNINFLNSIPLPTTVSGGKADAALTYQSPFAYTPEVWNCFLAPYVADASTSGRLQSQCVEARAARTLTIPIVILAALMSVVTAWAWWSASRAANAEPEMVMKDVDEVSVESKN